MSDYFIRLIQRVAPKSYAQAGGEIKAGSTGEGGATGSDEPDELTGGEWSWEAEIETMVEVQTV